MIHYLKTIENVRNVKIFIDTNDSLSMFYKTKLQKYVRISYFIYLCRLFTNTINIVCFLWALKDDIYFVRGTKLQV